MELLLKLELPYKLCCECLFTLLSELTTLAPFCLLAVSSENVDQFIVTDD